MLDIQWHIHVLGHSTDINSEPIITHTIALPYYLTYAFA